MENCIFCKIAKDESPSYKIYEDKEFVVFLSIYPSAKGHALVVPKEHHRWVWDYPNIGKYFELAQKVANAQKKAFNTELIVGMQVGEEVPHAHISLIPKQLENYHEKDHSSPSFTKEEMAEIAKSIADCL